MIGLYNPQVPRSLIIDLATARFVREHGGVLLIGPPGTGKSHIAISQHSKIKVSFVMSIFYMD